MGFRVIGILAVIFGIMATIGWFFFNTMQSINAIANSATGIEAGLIWQKKMLAVGQVGPSSTVLKRGDRRNLVIVSGTPGVAFGHRIQGIGQHDGHVIWSRKLTFPVNTRPVTVDLNRDGVEDIIVAGASPKIVALNGLDGAQMWMIENPGRSKAYQKASTTGLILSGDIDGDGVKDLICSQTLRNGGGRLFKISAAKGKVRSSIAAPTGYTYRQTPAYMDIRGLPTVIVTTVDTSNKGTLIAYDFQSLQEKWRYKSPTKDPFLSPVLSWSLNSKTVPFAAVITKSGTIVKLAAESGEELWTRDQPGVESVAPPIVGFFNGDEIIDIAAAVKVLKPYAKAKKAAPKEEGTKQSNSSRTAKAPDPEPKVKGHVLWLDGGSGSTIHEKQTGEPAATQPLALDLNNDRQHELVIYFLITDRFNNPLSSELAILDGQTFVRSQTLTLPWGAAAAPLIVDTDDNGKLDLITAVDDQLRRFQFSQSHGKGVAWNAESGPDKTRAAGF